MLEDTVLHDIAERLSRVAGIDAVVLGGSRARGTHHAGSDVDLGLYYDADRLDVDALRAAAREVAGPGADVTGPGGWGPWVDGGGWLQIDETPVDLILRDVARVREQRDRARRGQFAFHHQLGHPLGFLDVGYAAEAAVCRPLSDPTGVVPQLREGLDPYPEPLRRTLVALPGDAEFLLAGAAKATVRGDVAYVQLCCSTAVMWCAHAWYARAGVWVMNEKGLVPGVAGLPIPTGDFGDRATSVLAQIGTDPSPSGLDASVRQVAELVSSTHGARSAAGSAEPYVARDSSSSGRST